MKTIRHIIFWIFIAPVVYVSMIIHSGYKLAIDRKTLKNAQLTDKKTNN